MACGILLRCPSLSGKEAANCRLRMPVPRHSGRGAAFWCRCVACPWLAWSATFSQGPKSRDPGMEHQPVCWVSTCPPQRARREVPTFLHNPCTGYTPEDPESMFPASPLPESPLSCLTCHFYISRRVWAPRISRAGWDIGWRSRKRWSKTEGRVAWWHSECPVQSGFQITVHPQYHNMLKNKSLVIWNSNLTGLSLFLFTEFDNPKFVGEGGKVLADVRVWLWAVGWEEVRKRKQRTHTVP